MRRSVPSLKEVQAEASLTITIITNTLIKTQDKHSYFVTTPLLDIVLGQAFNPMAQWLPLVISSNNDSPET